MTAKNIILFITDQWRWDTLNQPGHPCKLPHLQAFRDEATNHVNAFTSVPLCTPARGSLFTGKWPHQTGPMDNVQGFSFYPQGKLPPSHKTYMERLQEAGYDVSFIGKWHLGSRDPRFLPTERGFDSFYGHLNGGIGYFDHVFSGGLDWQRNGVTIREDGHASSLLAAEARRIVEAQPTEQPFFMLLAFNAPHTPLEEPDGSGRGHSGRLSREPTWPSN